MQTDIHSTDFEDSKVLIVEDNESLAELYSTWLANDHEVYTAYATNEAVDVLDKSVDIVILDRRLPKGSGETVLEEIQNRSLDCMIAMVTAVTPEIDIATLPIDDYLVKPIERETLQSKVEELLLRSTVAITRQELLALLSRKIVLEEENEQKELEQASKYQELCQKIHLLKSELGVSLQHISSRHRPDFCPDCGLRWNIDIEGTVGFISMASRVWKCVNCGSVIEKPDPSNRSVARGR